ncbi:MAG: FHA domain-containing protein, partial [Acetobacteraceae bacterium]|nr:FHA domain-containing protein [Acetobacteraceae bacterium]
MLTSGTLSIGRGPGNDWVLPDPERHLSKTHCVLSIENGRTILTDLSTNGVHINGARQATARDSRTVLTDGDTFRLGEYTITVTEIEDARPVRGGAMSADPFADLGARGGRGDPFDTAAGPEEGGSPLDVDPLEDPLGRPPDPAFHHPVAHRPIGPRREDPFDLAEERGRRPVDPDADLFRGVKPTVDWQGPTQPDHADAPRHAFGMPRVLPTTDPNAIDFDALIGDIPPAGLPPHQAPPAPASPHAPRPRPSPHARDPFGDDEPLLPSLPASQAPAPARAAPLPSDPFADLEAPAPASRPPPSPAASPGQPPGDLPPSGPAAARPSPPSARAPTPADPFAEPERAAPSPAPAPAGKEAGADASAAIQAFLDGA